MGKVTQINPNANRDLSSVKEELQALDWELIQIYVSINSLIEYNELANEYEAKSVLERLDTARMRALRAEQISRGLKVYKPT